MSLTTAQRINESYQHDDNSYYFASKSSEELIEFMKGVAEKIQDHFSDELAGDYKVYCWLDDWGRFDNYQLCFQARPSSPVAQPYPRGLSIKVKAMLNRLVKQKGATNVALVQSPQSKYVSDGWGGSYFEGYDDDTWIFDVDF